MTLREVIFQLLYIFITAAVPVLAAYIVQLIRTKINMITEDMDNKILARYLSDATEAITTAVLTVNQTYVDDIKAAGKFDAEAQEHAKKTAVELAKTIMSDMAKEALKIVYGDAEAYIDSAVEKTVRSYKTYSIE